MKFHSTTTGREKMRQPKHIVIDQDYYHGQQDQVFIHLSPAMKTWLAHGVGDRKTVLHSALEKARARVVDLLDEIDHLLARLPRD